MRSVATLPPCIVVLDERTLQNVAICPACLCPLGPRTGQVASCVNDCCQRYRKRHRGVPTARGGRPIGRGDMMGRAERVTSRDVRAVMLEIGRRYRDLRLERDISLGEIEAATGVHPSVVSRLERGQVRGRNGNGITMRTLIAIVRAIDARLSEVMP